MKKEILFTVLLLIASFVVSGFGLLLPGTAPAALVIYLIHRARSSPGPVAWRDLTLFAFTLTATNITAYGTFFLSTVLFFFLPAKFGQPPLLQIYVGCAGATALALAWVINGKMLRGLRRPD